MSFLFQSQPSKDGEEAVKIDNEAKRQLWKRAHGMRPYNMLPRIYR